MVDNDFEMAPGCGDRNLVSIGACTNVELRGTNRFVAGANPAALEFEPTREARPEGSPIGALNLDPATLVQGPLRWRGAVVTFEKLLSSFPRVPEHPAAKAGDKAQPDKPKDP